MQVRQIYNLLLGALQSYGSIPWYSAATGSMYIKFRDTRLGFIRIADHPARGQYSYKYELSPDSTNDEIDEVYFAVIQRSHTISGFNPQVFVVYDQYLRQYIELDTLEGYREFILKPKENT